MRKGEKRNEKKNIENQVLIAKTKVCERMRKSTGDSRHLLQLEKSLDSIEVFYFCGDDLVTVW